MGLNRYQKIFLGILVIGIVLGILFYPDMVSETVISEKYYPLDLYSGQILQISAHKSVGQRGFWVLSSSDGKTVAFSDFYEDDSQTITVQNGGHYILHVGFEDVDSPGMGPGGAGRITVSNVINMAICYPSVISLLILGIYNGFQLYRERTLAHPVTQQSNPVLTLPSQLKYCYKCGQMLRIEALFCSRCGVQQQTYTISVGKSIPDNENQICPKCSAPLQVSLQWCPFCGTALH